MVKSRYIHVKAHIRAGKTIKGYKRLRRREVKIAGKRVFLPKAVPYRDVYPKGFGFYIREYQDKPHRINEHMRFNVSAEVHGQYFAYSGHEGESREDTFRHFFENVGYFFSEDQVYDEELGRQRFKEMQQKGMVKGMRAGWIEYRNKPKKRKR